MIHRSFSRRRLFTTVLACALACAVVAPTARGAGGPAPAATTKPAAIKKPVKPQDPPATNWDRMLAKPNRPVYSTHLAIPPGEDEAFLLGVIDKIFPRGHAGLTAEQKAIEIMRFVVSYLRLKANSGTVTQTIKDGYSICGGMSETFRTLCRLADLPAKYVGMMNIPGMRSHAISEVFYNGKWHFYDATYGIFFYTKPDYDRSGRVVSYHDLLTDPDSAVAFRVVDKPWTGKYDAAVRSFGVKKCPDDYLEKRYGKPLIPRYRKYLRVAFPVVYDRGDIASFPVDADLREQKIVWYGKIDKSGRDVVGDSNVSGLHYVGGNSLRAFHTWLIVAPGLSANVRIVYHSHGAGDNPPELQLVPFRAARLISTHRKGNAVTFHVTLNSQIGIVGVFCRKGTFYIDAMQIHRD